MNSFAFLVNNPQQPCRLSFSVRVVLAQFSAVNRSELKVFFVSIALKNIQFKLINMIYSYKVQSHPTT